MQFIPSAAISTETASDVPASILDDLRNQVADLAAGTSSFAETVALNPPPGESHGRHRRCSIFTALLHFPRGLGLRNVLGRKPALDRGLL
jgi:hypothetical protein